MASRAEPSGFAADLIWVESDGLTRGCLRCRRNGYDDVHRRVGPSARAPG